MMPNPTNSDGVESMNYIYGVDTAVFIGVSSSIAYTLQFTLIISQVMICMYLVGVMYLVWSQVNQVVEEEDMVLVFDEKGKADVKKLDKVLRDKENIII